MEQNKDQHQTKTKRRAAGAVDRGGPWAVGHGRHETTRQEIDLRGADDDTRLVVVYPPLWKIWVRQLGWWATQYMENTRTYTWLVVGPPLWKIWTSIGMTIPNIWKTQEPIPGWWLGHPSERYEFVNWDDEQPNINGKINMMATKPPTRWYDDVTQSWLHRDILWRI